MSRIRTFLELAVKQGGSDLHLVTGHAPRIRIHGLLHRVRFRNLSLEDMEQILTEFMDERLWTELNQRMSVDFAYQADGLGRFRVNAFRHVHGLAAVLRVVPNDIRSVEELGLPRAINRVLTQPSGLVLVTGPTGSGKSTTLAAMVDHINRTRRGHIVTIEDPIEFVHPHQRCVVTQREVGTHSPSFSEALRNALREDPDVILVGEMRDLETIGLALTAAETGIQVMGSLHTHGAVRTIDRIINVFPARRHDQVRSILAESLKLVVSQQLVPRADSRGRVAVHEVLVNTHAVGSMIRLGKAHHLGNTIQSGAREGMQGMDAELKKLVLSEVITPEEAYHHAIDKGQFSSGLARSTAA